MHHRFHSRMSFSRHEGRGSGARGAGRFGKGFMDNGGRGFGMGRKLGSPDLQLLVLSLLAEKPMHGYEIIKALDERSKGFYVPSPGMIYPALTYLEEIGHATVEVEGTRKRYSITAAGLDHLQQHRATAEALLAQFGRVGERMERVRRAMNEDDRDGSSGGTEDRELRRARHELKAALADKWAASAEERKRIAGVLERATAEILGKK